MPGEQATSVAVTGLGLMTALGLDLRSSWEGLTAGRSPMHRFRLFDPAGLSTVFGAELPEGAEALFEKLIKPRSRSQMTRGTMIALAAAQMAIEDSGIDLEHVDRTRMGVVIGATGTGYAPTSMEADPQRILKNMANAPAAWISLKWKLEGPSYVVSTACSSGTYALHSAFHLIESGQCDIVIAGAADSSISYPDVQGFCSLMALSEQPSGFETASRPFDRRRSGFVVGEGGGILVLESHGFARKRRARIYAGLPLPGLTSEAYNILSPEPGGRGMARTMERALRQARLSVQDISYINAHGTSTPYNDLCETQAIKTVFGDRARTIPVSSTKSMTGHCLSAAAGVEAVICCKAIAEECIPPTANLTEPDPECDLDYVPNTARKARLRHVMSNSFAFGGHNGVAIFSRQD